MSEHTPGPWQIKKWPGNYTDGFEYVVADTRGHGLLTMCQKGKNAKTLANARLIAAAPDLAENQRDVCGRFPVGPLVDLNRYTITVTGQSVNQWRKTLAKATK